MREIIQFVLRTIWQNVKILNNISFVQIDKNPKSRKKCEIRILTNEKTSPLKVLLFQDD